MNETVLLACRNPQIVETVTALGLALDITVEVVADTEPLRDAWPSAGLRLVGPDMAGRAAHLAPHGQVWVVGDHGDELVGASAELGVPALALPEHVGRLAEVMRQALHASPTARHVAVVGASGGLGASSLTVGLADLAAREGPAALIELVDDGGGLDLLLGAETQEGFRWSQLAGARGELGPIDGLVRVDGVDVLALDREDITHPDEAATAAVLRSLHRSHSTVVLDVGRTRLGEWLTDAHVLVLASADVRGVAAARMMLGRHPLLGRAQLVVRSGPGRDLPPVAVADAVGLPLAGVLRQDAVLPRLAAEGSSVAAPVARRFRRDVHGIWEAVSK